MKNQVKYLPLILFLGLAALAGSSDGNDWPNFRGNGYDGTRDQAGLFAKGFGLDLAWKKEIGSGYSSVSLAEGIAVTMTSDGTDDLVVALAADSGKELWRYRISATYKGHDGSHDGTIATPAIDGGRVYGLGANGHLFAVELKTGKEVWAQHIAKDLDGVAQTYGFGSSPLVVGNVLVVQTGGENSAVSGLDKNTGKRLWKAGQDVISYQSPILAKLLGKQQIICPGDKKLFGIDPSNGTLLWEYKHDGGDTAYNPVMVGDDQIFIRPGNETVMLRASVEGTTYTFAEVWKSREIGNTTNVSVYHEGYLYGYSGRFLACIDAKTGKRMWKSRPPGDGFTILVEDHLVVMSQAGTLHLIEATPEAYREKASIDVFGSLTWTPASFAYGKIYMRNLSHIAAVDVGRAKETLAVVPEKHGILPQTKFGAWVSKLAETTDKSAAVDAFMKAQKSFPVIEDERYVHVIYRGPAEDASITGDHLETGVDHGLNKVPGTDLSYYSFELVPDAHIAYQMSIDYQPPGPDPSNPNQAQSFRAVQALLAMPRWSDSGHMATVSSGGELKTLEFDSKITGGKRKVQVYLPADYSKNEARLPVLYVNYGSTAIDQGGLTTTLDNVIGKTVKPLIAVFIDLSPANNFGELGGEQGKKYARMLAEELVPYIDAKYRTQAKAEARALLGASSGGYMAVLTALTHADVFSMAASQSTNLAQAREEEILGLAGKTPRQPVRFVLEWGSYDSRNVGNQVDFPGKNAKIAKALRDAGYQVDGGEQHLGNGWGNWRTRLDDILRLLFPIESM